MNDFDYRPDRLSIAAVVAKGAAVLDTIKPGWWKEGNINLSTLDQASGQRCVVAQNWGGSYSNGISSIREAQTGRFSTVDSGFCSYGDRQGGSVKEYRDLTVEWKRVIRERRAGVTPVNTEPGMTEADILRAARMVKFGTLTLEAFVLDLLGRPAGDLSLVTAAIG